eukprot:m.311574 g.311574  ORF g.311574 m.311574 type:complete len:82 (-) comp23044_c2_seq26:239-484(-)
MSDTSGNKLQRESVELEEDEAAEVDEVAEVVRRLEANDPELRKVEVEEVDDDDAKRIALALQKSSCAVQVLRYVKRWLCVI